MTTIEAMCKIATGRSFGSPLYLIFFVTNRCNARCAHCFYASRTNNAANELTLGEIDQIARGTGPLYAVNLTGGEPFLRNDLKSIARALHRYSGLRVLGLFTNGLLSESIIDTVRGILKDCPDLRVDVTVSLDAIGEAHDRIRGVSGIYKAACETLLGLKGIGSGRLSAGVNMVVSASNAATINDSYSEIKSKLAPDYIAPLLVRGNIPEPGLREFDLTAYDRLCERVERDQRRQRTRDVLLTFLLARDAVARAIGRKSRREKVDLPCHAGSLTGVISEEGVVYPCETLDIPIGSLRDNGYNFRELWTSPKASEIRDRIIREKCFCTHECFMNANVLFAKRLWPRILWKSFV